MGTECMGTEATHDDCICWRLMEMIQEFSENVFVFVERFPEILKLHYI